jgi:hypothetical protein
MQFLGPCEVCGRRIRTYRSLSLHLHRSTDPEHANLLTRWERWRSEYRATRRCRKCGGLWESKDKASKDAKRCPKCEVLRSTLSKRQYEALSFTFPEDPRGVMSSGSKASWDGLRDRKVCWAPGDEVCLSVVGAALAGEPIPHTLERVGVSYEVYRQVLLDTLGESEVERLSRAAKTRVGRENIAFAHAKYNAMTPEEKAAYAKARFGGVCALEAEFGRQLDAAGVRNLHFDSWQTLLVGGRRVPRQADIKVEISDGRKIVVLCDGEAFHGPKAIFGDPVARVAADRETALA